MLVYLRGVVAAKGQAGSINTLFCRFLSWDSVCLEIKAFPHGVIFASL